ncbi:MAG TPA: hybrid sensor histidine kinase/response regulator [Polyangiales bacterium]|nr:hybrid sensor histidine kinase/response regulator [Polyangiales bacterium]
MSTVEERFLILAPTGRDASLTAALLVKAGLECAIMKSLHELCETLQRDGAAALLIAEEVFAAQSTSQLAEQLAAQSAWSDLPIVIFTSTRGEPTSAQLLGTLGNVTFLDRPLRPVTMLSAAHAALRARRRQYAAREELKVQQRAVRERDQFLAMLGHELRNPLSAITMALNLDREGGGNKYREIMRRQTSHLGRLVDDLLDVSRVTSGKIQLRKERVDLAALVQRCFVSVGPALTQHQTRLQLGERSLLVEGDPVRLEQVVVNLLNNAIKYTPAGGRISVSLDAEHDEVVLRVRDNGVGISGEMIDRVFDLFAQAESTLDRAKGGMGIGLTLVRTLVQMHQGQVEVASAGLDQGTLFTVRLPRSGQSITSTTQENTAKIVTRRHDLVLVEDNDDSRELLSLLLREYGHRVRTAADGLCGVDVALAAQPDVMLVDIGLPGLDGYGVARRVREAYGSVPYLVALTGYGQPEDRARALASGFDEHLTKPVDIKALEKLLAGVSPARRVKATTTA